MNYGELVQFIRNREKALQSKKRVAFEKGIVELYNTFNQQILECQETLTILESKQPLTPPTFWKRVTSKLRRMKNA